MYEFHWQSNDCVSNKYITEPVRLIGEGNYNLNVLKEIDVTDSYLGLDQEVRGCQNEEPQDHCRTRVHRDTLLEQCGCLPFNMRLSDKVWIKLSISLKQRTQRS